MERGIMLRSAVLSVVLLAALPLWAAPPGREGPRWCGTTRNGARDAVAAHRERGERVRAASARTASLDVGQIAVLQDEGDLALLRNPFDLQNAALRFGPVDAGFSVARLTAPLFPEAGTPLALGDDDTAAVPLPFAFPFYGAAYRTVQVNSDGNLTFGEPDSASTARNIGRLLFGPPRIAPLLADLDPASGGSVAWSAVGDRFSVTWTDVPQFDQTDRNTFQVSLYADGRVEMAYGTVTAAIDEGVVGIAPGGSAAGLAPVDFSAAAGQAGVALAESLRASDGLDLVAVARKFYLDHPDDYDQLVVFTNRRLVETGTFAFEQTLQNEVQGIGAGVFDLSDAYGSGGRLHSVTMMDSLGKYPDDPSRVFLGADSGLGVLAHEVGHRWLAQATFLDGERVSRELLGRDEVHWSFFFDTDGSHLEGNDVADEGGGRFRTVAAGVRYSALDQYLMGLRDAAEVPPMFFVRNPTGIVNDPARDPEVGVSFSGTRRDLTLADLLAAMGRRQPPFGESPRTIRQAFVYVAVGAAPAAADIQKLERIRAAWEPYYAASTDGRGAAEARLN
jgi:hypothetical protein